MELFKLIPTTWLPGDTFRNFKSLVWTERYQTPGDFQMVAEDDISILGTLPIGTLFSHTDTTEVMIVETHEIGRAEDKKLTVTLTGRSFTSFLESRITNGSLLALETAGVKQIETITGTSGATAQQLIKNAIVSGTALAADVVANVDTALALRVADTSQANVIQRGDVASRVLEYLQLGNYGVKTARPNGAVTTMRLTVHDGLDLHTTIIFYAQNDDLIEAKYFWSEQAYRNYANVGAKTYNHEYRQRALVADVTGLLRRRMYVEASDLDGTYTFGSTDGVVAARAQYELAGQPKIQILAATISKTALPKFKINYNIGDLVTVFGEFSASSIMRVTEHILTKDENGIQGYPALSIA